MQNNRKYQNDQELKVSKTNKYNFSKIIIVRKEKSSKKNPDIKYLCHVYLEDGTLQTGWVITEKRIDELIK